MLNFWYNSWIQSSWLQWLVFILWCTSFPQTWVLFKFFAQIFSLGLWHFFTNKFTILGFNILNLHNLGHVYFLPKYAQGEERAYSPSFPRFWCGKIDQSQVLWSVASCDANDKIESLLQKVELRSTLRNMLPQLATSKFVAWQVESEGGNTGNNAFQLATQQCCATSCAKMLPVLLDLKSFIQWFWELNLSCYKYRVDLFGSLRLFFCCCWSESLEILQNT